MKRIDLHIHTIPTSRDAHFDFSLEKLKDYVSIGIDAIAITNHNIFNLEQYNLIKKTLDCVVFPGVEVNLEGGHILVITSHDNIEKFDDACKKLEYLNEKEFNSLTYDEFKNIFDNFNDYLFIPHYEKSPKISNATIKKFEGHIFTGEVSNYKKFISAKKNNQGLAPVIFSDCRISNNLNNFSLQQTYLKVDNLKFSAIKYALRDKEKIFSSRGNNENFIILPDGTSANNGINVILGKRSSGKTYTLNKISETFKNVKYIKQFSLLEKDTKEEKRKFTEKVTNKEIKIKDDYLKEFKTVCDDMLEINLSDNENKFQEFYDSLIALANYTQDQDIYAKTKIFNETSFEILDDKELSELIKSLEILLDTVKERELIEKYLERNKMIDLLFELIKKKDLETYKNSIKKITNDIVEDIQDVLSQKSATPQIKDTSFINYYMNKYKVNIFDKIVDKLKCPFVLEKSDLYGFSIEAKTRRIESAAEIRKISGKREGDFEGLFGDYNTNYNYLLNISKKINIPKAESYKYFINVDYKILNKYGFEVSGGEMAEFNLMSELDNASNYDMLLIDEPESSFDNLFIKENVNKMIRDLSKEMPVFIATHNNTIGISIKPDYIIYTQRLVDNVDNKAEYYVYGGNVYDTYLYSMHGKKINTKNILYDTLEAGEDTYIERRKIYENT